jgi:hypothetical protein
MTNPKTISGRKYDKKDGIASDTIAGDTIRTEEAGATFNLREP